MDSRLWEDDRFPDEHQATLALGSSLLGEIGFPSEFSATLLESVAVLDSAWDIDLSKSRIEVQIVSSADGCSHLVGPFFYFWWWENSDKPFEDLMADNRQKIFKDWHRKIVLPEAKDRFEPRYRILVEQSGMIPESYLRRPLTQ